MMTVVSHARIASLLAEVEEQERVRVCLAVESGSRAWGFPSVDSDYDVRFVYAHHPDWYLSIEAGRDVIERPLTDMIDLSGWDIRKALKLFGKSNPPLLEWLQCPIVYIERGRLASTLRRLLTTSFLSDASFYHYVHMARGNFREYLQGATVWRKKYLYVLRPLLATRWIADGRGPVPIEFARLLDAALPTGEVRAAIDELVMAKAAGKELDDGPRIAVISEFIEGELVRFESRQSGRDDDAMPVAELDRLFRSTLHEVWSDVPA